MKRLNFFDKLLHLFQAPGRMQKRTGAVAEWVESLPLNMFIQK